MRIAIDTSPLRSGHTDRGVGVYTRNLIESLGLVKSGHTFIQFDSTSQSVPEADVIHYPFFDPFFLNLPLYSPKPTIVTVHDLIPILFPEHFPKGFRGSVKWEIQKYSLRRKQWIITDSECSRNDIHRIIGFDKERITSIPLASSLRAGKIGSLKGLEKQHGIKSPYFLYVGDVNWNKNIAGLLKAFSSFASGQSKNIQLVLVGKAFLSPTLDQAREINQMISDLKIEKYVVRTGYVDIDELSSLYTHALGLIQPSWYEGFGFPVLEAMSLGCPVVCSSSSSLPEIAGPSITVDVKSQSSLVDGMKYIAFMSKEKRNALIQKGITWAHTFTWEKTASKTIEVYERSLK